MSDYLIHAIQFTLGAVMLWCELSSALRTARAMLPEYRQRYSAWTSRVAAAFRPAAAHAPPSIVSLQA
jgi:hypothetical protein